MKQVLLAVLVIVMLASIVWLPVPIPTGTDFQVLYTADLALIRAEHAPAGAVQVGDGSAHMVPA